MDPFKVEDLLDFSDGVVGSVVAGKDEIRGSVDGVRDGSCTAFSSVAAIDRFSSTSHSNSGYYSCVGNGVGSVGCGSSFSSDVVTVRFRTTDHFVDMEWLNSFVEESFSKEEIQNMQLITGVKTAQPEEGWGPNDGLHHDPPLNMHQSPSSPIVFNPDMPVPGKARSKRPRACPGKWAATDLLISDVPGELNASPRSCPDNWAVSDLLISDVPGEPDANPRAFPGNWSTNDPLISDVSGEPDATESKKIVRVGQKRKQLEGSSGVTAARKCLHCLTEKTPQWRTGPLGPKTLCNACGVRYKSGRLVPEYRPASSPTFMLAEHSNSHRKVLELRRQKELMRTRQFQQEFVHTQNRMFGFPNEDDYINYQHLGTDLGRFR